MYLVSSKVASNQAKITNFLHLSYIQLATYTPSIITRIWTSQKNFAWKMEKSVKDMGNRSEGVQSYPECQGFHTFFSFHALQNIGKANVVS